MSLSRAAKSRVFNRVAQWFAGSAAAHDEAAVRMAEMAAVLHSRETGGEVTTLRQLHKIAELTQPEALTIVDRLERAGLVEIAHNVGDRFESTISLTEATRRRLDRATKGRAA